MSSNTKVSIMDLIMGSKAKTFILNMYSHLFFGKILRFLTIWKCIPGILVGGIVPTVLFWVFAPNSGKFSLTVVLVGLCLYLLELICCALFSLVEVSAKMIVGWLFVDSQT